MNKLEHLGFYGKHISIEVEDFDWYYLLATRYQKDYTLSMDQYRNLSKDQREAYDKEKQYVKDRTDRLRRFRYELSDLPSGTIIQLEKRLPAREA